MEFNSGPISSVDGGAVELGPVGRLLSRFSSIAHVAFLLCTSRESFQSNEREKGHGMSLFTH